MMNKIIERNDYMSLKGTTLSKEGLEYLCGLINKIVSSPKDLLDDINLATNTTFSSVRIDSLIADTLQQANTHAEALCNALTKLTCEKTTTQPTLNNSEKNVIYLYSADGNAPFHQYLKISDTELIDMGSTSISLNDYLTITDAVATYCKKTDFDALKTGVDKVKTTLGNESLNTTSQTVTGAINELNDKSTMVTLTQAEYNQLVADGTIDNDTYYIISDDSENIDLNKFNIKTYTSLNQLGLTTPISVGDLFVGLPDNSLLRIQCDNDVITGVPHKNGVLIIDKCSSSKFSIEFKISAGGSVNDNTLYIGQLKGVDGTGLSWRRVCTTNVADVPKTNIVPADKTTFVNFAGNCNYCVKNGVCYVTVWKVQITSTGKKNTGIYLPKSSIGGIAGVHLTGNQDSTPHAYAYILQDGYLYFDVKDANIELYGSFSYPVLES